LVTVPLGDEHHDCQLEPRDILLKREIPIDGEKDLEVSLGEGEQFAVLLTRPTHLGNRSRLMPDQVALQALGKAFIKQDSHVRTRLPSPAPRLR